jgi:hypothetical protein
MVNDFFKYLKLKVTETPVASEYGVRLHNITSRLYFNQFPLRLLLRVYIYTYEYTREKIK